MGGTGFDPAYPFQPGPYQAVLTGAHREVCGGESQFHETFNDFMSRLVNEGTPAEQRILQDIRRGRGANPKAAVAAYRRFLNRGEECPKFSPGYERWTKIRDARPVAPGSLSVLDSGDLAFSGAVALGTVPESIDPRELGTAFVIPAEEAPLSPAGVPQLTRLGEVAYDASGSHPFGDVIEIPADSNRGTPAITVVRGMDGYSASILVGGDYAGDVSLIDDYTRRVGAIEDPHLLLAAWNDYVRDLSWRMQELANAVEDITAAYERDRENLRSNRIGDIPLLISATKKRVARAIATFRAILDASAAFGRPADSPIAQTWEYTFLRAQLAKLNNHVGPILSWDYSGDTLEEVGTALANLRKSLVLFFDPFDHLHYSYEIDLSIGRRINVTLGEGRPGAAAVNPVALRRIVDEIVYQAGLASPGGEQKGYLRVEWNPATGELSFADAGEGGLLFDAFRSQDGEDSRPLSPLVALLGLVSQLGTGANFHIDTDPSDGHVTRIRVAVPLASVPPAPAGGGGAGGDPPSADGTGTPEASPSSPTSTASAFGGTVDVLREAAGTPAADTDGAAADPWTVLPVNPTFPDGAVFPGIAVVPVRPASPVAP